MDNLQATKALMSWYEGRCDQFNTHLFDMLAGEALKTDLKKLEFAFSNRVRIFKAFQLAPDPVTFFEERGLTVEEKVSYYDNEEDPF